jgi:hypothetical protein
MKRHAGKACEQVILVEKGCEAKHGSSREPGVQLLKPEQKGKK